MAVLPQPASTFNNPFADQVGDALPPEGTFNATILDIKDEFGATRKKYQSEETEQVDLTCFLFGFRDEHNTPHKLASRRMKISCKENAALFDFLKSLTGKAPKAGWDYCELKGRKCLLTVEHKERKDGTGAFPSIAALSPVPVAPAAAAPTAPADNEDDVPF